MNIRLRLLGIADREEHSKDVYLVGVEDYYRCP